MAAYNTVRQSIVDRQPIRATYQGRVRELCAHIIGHKRGREQTLCYQFGGESSSGLGPDGSPNNWRCMFIDGMEQVEIIDGEWHSAPNHSRPQTCVDEIDVEVVD